MSTLKYLQIKDSIDRLVAGMSHGDKLPSERALAKKHKCNLLTLRKAMEIVQNEGKVMRRRGSGTFVIDPSLVRATKARTTLGVILPPTMDVFGNNLVREIAAESASQSIHLVFSALKGQAEGDITGNVRHLADHGCNALLLPFATAPWCHRVVLSAQSIDLPAVTSALIPGLDQYCFEAPALFGKSVVSTITKQVRYFLSMGRKQIALLVPDVPDSINVSRRISAYINAVRKHGLRQLCAMAGNTADDMDCIATEWKSLQGTLAIIAYDDTHALRLISAMHKLGLVAPEDFLIMGHNNIEAAVYADPPLSTIVGEYDYIAHWMVRHALALARGTSDQSHKGVEPGFVIRESCGGRQLLGDRLSKILKKNNITAVTDTVVRDLSVA